MDKTYLYPECLQGNHVPVAIVDESNRCISVSCQNCGAPMTKEQYKEYFKDKPSLLDYDRFFYTSGYTST